MTRRIGTLSVVTLLLLLPAYVAADTHIMTYQPAPLNGLLTDPYTEDGITMTPLSGHYDIEFCCSDPNHYANIDSFTGTAYMQFTFAGGVFDLVSINFLGAGQTGHLTSSTGAIMDIVGGQIYNFSGPDWTGISFFTLDDDTGHPYGATESYIAFDDVTISGDLNAVPEPASIALLGSGLVGLAARLRRKKI